MKSMVKPANTEYHRTHYDKFYAGDGWKTTLKMAIVEVNMIATRLNWQPGQRILDLGCGQGTHTEALRILGFNAVGVDMSLVGIDRSKKTYKDATFIHGDLSVWEPEPLVFDSIYCRGMSWYHYELNGINRNKVNVPYETARFFTWLPTFGEFILQIATDFTGVDSSSGILNNTVEAYTNLFTLFGTIKLLYDWRGKPIGTGSDKQYGIIIATEKED